MTKLNIKIAYLKNYSQTISELASIWHNVLGRTWLPDMPIERIVTRFSDHLNDQDLPITFVALDGEIPVGMCSLRENDGIRPDLIPWLGSLVITPNYQKQGIGKLLINATVEKAKQLDFKKIYLFAFDPTVPSYYERLGWKKIGTDEFKSHTVTVMELVL